MPQSFAPIVFQDSAVLILGSMPGIRSLERNQYYGHARNAFWPILFDCFEREFTDDYIQKECLLKENRLALWDVLSYCERRGSLDSDIKSAQPNDIEALLRSHPGISSVLFNGQAAARYYRQLIRIDQDRCHYRVLPSTSPAHTMKFENKKEVWITALKEAIGR